jgi:serine/threonine-protein kinase
MAERQRPGGEGATEPEALSFTRGLVLDGRYRLERPLAEGGMGSIWVGQQMALEREVAIKLLRVESSAPLRARLRREALALAAVHHPSIVEVYDYGETPGGSPYLVMELVRGEPLGQRVLREGPLPVAAAVQLVVLLLEGLAAAHRAGIVHRDIKPDNIVLTSSPAGPQPKLLDFGIARIGRADAARLTTDGGFIGTPAYMAPEQVRGATADERADVWGMGAVLYELCSGQPPFGIDDVIAVLRRVMDEPPSFPRNAAGMDGKLWSILTGALRKDPAERTPSALALRDALVGWLEMRGLATRPAVEPPSAASTRAPNMPQEERLAPTLTADAPPAAPAPRPSAPRRVPLDSVDATADTAPTTTIGDPASFDALIRSRLGQS